MRLRALSLAVSAASLSCSALATELRPPLQIVRADEDYSALRAQAATDDPIDRLKFIALSSSGADYISFGGEIRERFDTVSAAGYGLGGVDDHYRLQRALLHADLHLPQGLRVYGELGVHEEAGKAQPAPIDRSRLNIQNLFFDAELGANKQMRFRVGRQELTFNAAQRFVAVREGPNIRQSFDGVRATWARDAWTIDGFAVHPVQLASKAFGNASDSTQGFWGAYVRRRFMLEGQPWALDVYALELDRHRVKFAGRLGGEKRQNLGARLAGHAGGFDLDAEALIQSGRFAGQPIQAWAASIDAGYTITQPWSPRVGFRLDQGSGDKSGQDGKLGTFNPLFPKGAYFDESSLTSWANLLAARSSLRVSPSPVLTVETYLSERKRQSVNDAVYVQPYASLARTLGHRNRGVDRSLGMNATWSVDRYVRLTGEWDRHWAGPVIKDARGRSSTFATIILQIRI